MSASLWSASETAEQPAPFEVPLDSRHEDARHLADGGRDEAPAQDRRAQGDSFTKARGATADGEQGSEEQRREQAGRSLRATTGLTQADQAGRGCRQIGIVESGQVGWHQI
ncbi:MAG: hypothetical protein HXX12_15395 [Geothrix sp.]|uniref:hypothetical protein n=1 Tax=Geothrix sp. TaxID=1962974 RepID=UPI00179A2C9A|nr:hypothetical protein [Geothrix sp.]NWJ42344.1 hypothetical protein [Geothrix sp.]WIL19689.1 MAG: hypothetical protein QOZ81_002216 [Geothrix sp.]